MVKLNIKPLIHSHDVYQDFYFVNLAVFGYRGSDKMCVKLPELPMLYGNVLGILMLLLQLCAWEYTKFW